LGDCSRYVLLFIDKTKEHSLPSLLQLEELMGLQSNKYDEETFKGRLFQYSDHAVFVAARLINSLIFCAVLLGPIIIMSYVSGNGRRLGVLVASVTIISILTTQLTAAKVWEVQAVTAA
jgi:hypothetical protein